MVWMCWHLIDFYKCSVPSTTVDQSNIGNRDQKLLRTYKGLANIRCAIDLYCCYSPLINPFTNRRACMISWSDKAAEPNPTYSGILLDNSRINKEYVFNRHCQAAPSLSILFYFFYFPTFFVDMPSYSLLLQSITFSAMGGYANLSRVDPARISTGVGSKTYLHAVGGGIPIIFTSVIVVKECYLEEPKTTANGKALKLIEGACIEGEWERLVGAIGQVIDRVEYKSQLYMGNLSFTTVHGSSDSGMSCPQIRVPLILIHLR
jgi:hypothetical protein